jgi:hypothetical protein
MKFARKTTCVLSAAVALALCGQSHAEEPNSKPSYCAAPGAYRLSECGQLTAQQMIDAEAKAAGVANPHVERSSTGMAEMLERYRPVQYAHLVWKIGLARCADRYETMFDRAACVKIEDEKYRTALAQGSR